MDEIRSGSPGSRPGRRAVERNARGWRQNWKRVPPGQRQDAAAPMADLFGTRKVRTVLPLVALASLLAHGGMLPFLALGKTLSLEEAISEDSYYRQVLQKDRARKVSKEIKDRLTMPPPPPDPQRVISETLSETLTTDIGKIVGDVADVKLTAKLTSRVKVRLEDELKAAARDIARGRYSQEEIRDLHEQFRRRAHDEAVAALKAHRIETQVERAAMSTTEWYEQDVSAVLMRNTYVEMFLRPHCHAIWCCRYTRGFQGSTFGQWGFLGIWKYRRKIDEVASLGRGIYNDYKHRHGGKPLQHGQCELPDWPEPSPRQGQAIAAVLRGIHKGSPTWEQAWNGYVEAFHPHRTEQVRREFGRKLERLWREAFASAEQYARLGAEQTAPAGPKAAQRECLAAVKRIAETAGKALVPDERPYQTMNQTIRSRVLRGELREKMYAHLMDQLVSELTPVIRDFARAQFKKGIIVHARGVDAAMKEFSGKIIPLLRRDLMAMFPKKVFDCRIFDMPYMNPYRSKVSGESTPPYPEDIERDERAMAEVVRKHPELADYAGARRKVFERLFTDAIERVKEETLLRALTGKLLIRNMGTFVEGVDYADRVREKLDARQMALSGRGQDLAQLTSDGLPDVAASLVALMLGASKGHAAALEPVPAVMQPGRLTPALGPGRAVRTIRPGYPPPGAKWGFETQPDVKPPFRTPRFEGIPFLPRFPRLDGDLTDWGKIRPLILCSTDRREILLWAAWNYQGLFFGYHVRQPAEQFYWPSMWKAHGAHDYFAIVTTRVEGYKWAYKGDYLQLLLDTLDARRANRGEPHTQEFVIFPRGTDSNPAVPGIERVIASQRDARTKQWRGVKASSRVFPLQPPPQRGPDGRGPYRATRVVDRGDRDRQGYTMEVFVPRSLLNVPVFCPGWHVGFDCAVATGAQRRFTGQRWAGSENTADEPDKWGDLLMLGTDPRIIVQQANAAGNVAHCVVPGQSYLVTVIDPDRNIGLSVRDAVLVSAEVRGRGGDVEVFVLEETEDNSSVFRGYVDTQPGVGRRVQGVLEVMPCRDVRLGYVDIGDSRGRRNVIFEVNLPVVSPVCDVATPGGRWAGPPPPARGK